MCCFLCEDILSWKIPSLKIWYNLILAYVALSIWLKSFNDRGCEICLKKREVLPYPTPTKPCLSWKTMYFNGILITEMCYHWKMNTIFFSVYVHNKIPTWHSKWPVNMFTIILSYYVSVQNSLHTCFQYQWRPNRYLHAHGCLSFSSNS